MKHQPHFAALPPASLNISAMLLLILSLFLFDSSNMVIVFAGHNFYEDVDIIWGDGRCKILDNGQNLSVSLDNISGSGFQSKNEYLYAKLDMQIKLVHGNSAGTVTAFYVSLVICT